jgi:cytochrome P450
VQDILLNLVFAGHETTASVALTLLRELPRHPEVMAQLRAEQDKVLLFRLREESI